MTLATSDGGATWYQGAPTSSMTYFAGQAFVFADSRHGKGVLLTGAPFISLVRGWVIGHKGTEMVTSDGGSTWQAQEIDTNRDLNAVCFIDERHGWAAGDNGTILAEHGGRRRRPRALA